jgi:glycosyltransferase involved in cell wall biosynthesis
MHIAIVHGYFLGDSGSAVYVRELAREFTHQGHEVTLVCQESHPGDYDFIDSFYELDGENAVLQSRLEGETDLLGSCRLVRPNLGGTLLTYVAGPFPGYEALPFQEASDSQVEEFTERNARALDVIFSRWVPDLVQANHLIMQPYLVHRVLGDSVPCIATIHGSALNFTARVDDRMAPYALTGLGSAVAIGALSETSCEDVIDFARENGLDIAGKTIQLPPGVDSALMRPAKPDQRSTTLRELDDAIDLKMDDIGIFAGRLLWTKGLHYAVAAMPLILQSRPGFRLIVVGDGPMEKPLRELIDLLDAGDLDQARELVCDNPELKPGKEYGDVIPELNPAEETAYIDAARGNLRQRVHFTGHLDHTRLAPLFAAADVSLAISVFPEAFALVSIEAMAAGALPIVTYQTGLRTAADIIATELADPALGQIKPGVSLTRGLADSVPSLLDRYPTREPGFRQRLHVLVDKNFSWSKVATRYIELSRNGSEGL